MRLNRVLFSGLCLSMLMPSVHANARVKDARLLFPDEQLAECDTELVAHGLAAPQRIDLAFPEPAAIDATVVRQAVAEATAIWAPYGLALSGTNPRDWIASEVMLLAIGKANAHARSPAPIVLGNIVFGPDGAPEPRITLFLDDVREFAAGSHVGGTEGWQRPRVLREQILGRVLGRVLAHEIGHYVLRSRQHTVAGLMRSVQPSDELAAPSRAGFTLSAAEAARLRAR
jgi:hypothetical protein